MNIKDALAILGLSASADPDAIKTAYRKACIKYHPDRNPAGLEMMNTQKAGTRAVNVAYQFLHDLGYNGAERPINEEVNSDFGDLLNAAINAVIGLAGISIEVCGAWVWVTGDTKHHKDTLKAAGYWWAPKKTAWYFRPPDHKSRNKGEWDLDKIRDTYGSTSVNHEVQARPALAH